VGKPLAEVLPAIYGGQAALVVVFISAEYAAGDWTRVERRAALARAVWERREYVLPARFDDTVPPGLLDDVVAVDLRGHAPERFAELLAAKLASLEAASPDGPRVPVGPPPAGRLLAGRLLAEVSDPFALEVHQPVQPEDPQPGLPDLPAYVPREHDKALGRLVRRRQGGRTVDRAADRDGHAAVLVRAAAGDPGAAGVHPAHLGPDRGPHEVLAAAGEATEGALCKLTSVVSRLAGHQTARAVIEAMIAGERDPRALAELGRGKMRNDRLPALAEALSGMRFGPQHAHAAASLLRAIDLLEAELRDLHERVAAHLAAIPASWGSGRGRRDRAGRRPGTGCRGPLGRGPAG
jgi:TIR domain